MSQAMFTPSSALTSVESPPSPSVDFSAPGVDPQLLRLPLEEHGLGDGNVAAVNIDTAVRGRAHSEERRNSQHSDSAGSSMRGARSRSRGNRRRETGAGADAQGRHPLQSHIRKKTPQEWVDMVCVICVALIRHSVLRLVGGLVMGRERALSVYVDAHVYVYLSLCVCLYVLMY